MKLENLFNKFMEFRFKHKIPVLHKLLDMIKLLAFIVVAIASIIGIFILLGWLTTALTPWVIVFVLVIAVLWIACPSVKEYED